MPEDTAIAPEPGTIFAGKYKVEQVLGVGGMGCVFAATHLALDQRVAIKLLLPELARDPTVVARFLREGRAAVKIKSEHVGRVLDVAAHDGVPYIVMEYLEGCDLAQLLEKKGRVTPAEAVDFVLQAGEALAEAHALHIVHRDLKPANLFLARTRDGERIKVLDFGISKMSVPEGADLVMTRTTSVMGSPFYMAPEQLVSAKDIDARADIWALGVLLFELVSGRVPFDARTLPELGALVLSTKAPDVRTIAPDVPAGLADIIATCLKTDRAARFPSIAELAAALAPFGSSGAAASADRIGKALIAIPRPPSTWSSTSSSINGFAATMSGDWTAEKKPTRRRWLAPVFVAAVLLGGGGFALIRFALPKSPATPITTDAPALHGSASVAVIPVSASVAPLALSSSTATAVPSSATSVASAPSAARPILKPNNAGAHPRVDAGAPTAAPTHEFTENRHE